MKFIFIYYYLSLTQVQFYVVSFLLDRTKTNKCCTTVYEIGLVLVKITAMKEATLMRGKALLQL